MTDPYRSKPFKSSVSPSRSSTSSPSPRHSLTLTQQFADVIRQYKYYTQHIQRLFKETNKSYNDINNTRVLIPGKKIRYIHFFSMRNEILLEKITEIQISESDCEYLNSLRTRPLALIIFSQTYNGKCHFVNELLNEKLLPEINNNDVVRMVRIKVEVRLELIKYYFLL